MLHTTFGLFFCWKHHLVKASWCYIRLRGVIYGTTIEVSGPQLLVWAFGPLAFVFCALRFDPRKWIHIVIRPSSSFLVKCQKHRSRFSLQTESTFLGCWSHLIGVAGKRDKESAWWNSCKLQRWDQREQKRWNNWSNASTRWNNKRNRSDDVQWFCHISRRQGWEVQRCQRAVWRLILSQRWTLAAILWVSSTSRYFCYPQIFSVPPNIANQIHLDFIPVIVPLVSCCLN